MGDEFALDAAGQNNRANVLISLGVADQLGQLLAHRGGHVVHRRIGHRPGLDVSFGFDFEEFHQLYLPCAPRWQ